MSSVQLFKVDSSYSVGSKDAVEVEQRASVNTRTLKQMQFLAPSAFPGLCQRTTKYSVNNVAETDEDK